MRKNNKSGTGYYHQQFLQDASSLVLLYKYFALHSRQYSRHAIFHFKTAAVISLLHCLILQYQFPSQLIKLSSSRFGDGKNYVRTAPPSAVGISNYMLPVDSAWQHTYLSVVCVQLCVVLLLYSMDRANWLIKKYASLQWVAKN